MKYLSLLLVAFWFAGTAAAEELTAADVGLYDTGTFLADGSNPYTLSSSSVRGSFGLYEPSSSVWPINGPWVDNTAETQWLAVYSGRKAPSSTSSVPTVSAGTYTITLTFDLGTLYSEYVSFSFVAAADNALSVALNGTTLTNSSTANSSGNNYGSLSYYSYTVDGAEADSALQDGVNTLTFVVTNNSSSGNNPAGLYVHFTDFTVAVPEPATYAALLGVGTLGFAFFRRRQRR